MTKTIDRPRYALTDWVVEMRNTGWFFTRYQDRNDRMSWPGAYRSVIRVSLVIARQIRREIEQRHAA